ncbi:HAD family phosphatase [Rhizobium sp. SSA_523]|uniref:HAD family hydrolase n=1 Tax=Rhizobium sp. SSA_523 TaxID=2952477 RepID=UPI0020916AB2|nr:HAD family phosphatase [Rhizobium sp. SSA_523]MCO5731019.1 HAD family phosphatase [Rhizobium sp. SSA_523]WKC24177.1 HAD family phosphatase [Rhizobium sp. SSA_523]
MSAKIDHIVFDIGKVLIHYDPTLPFRRLIPDDQERQQFFDTVCTHDWNLEQDRGRDWAEAEAELIKTFPGQEERVRSFRKFWPEMVPYAYDDSVAIFESLIDQGLDVTMLTNFAADTFVHARKLYPFLNRSRGITVSGEVKLIKPDVEIYRLHARTFGLEPSRTLFIDDTAANVEGARKAGWQTVQFFDAARLRADFADYGFSV